MDVEHRYNILTAHSGLAAVNASHVERFVRSPISFWCDLHAPRDRRDPPDPFQQHLSEVGRTHQENVVAGEFPGALRAAYPDPDEGFRLTLEMMTQGARYITEMPLISRPDGLEGRPDVLERVDGMRTDLGDYGYVVVEIKSAKHIREHHRLQGAAYSRMLGKVQGLEPDEFFVVNRDGERTPCRAEDLASQLDETLEDIRAVMAGRRVEPCHGAAEWPWVSFVDGLAEDANDVSLLSGVGEALRAELAGAGLATVGALAMASEESLIDVKGIKRPMAWRLVTSANALVQGRPVPRRNVPAIRRRSTEVFIDLEGTDPRIGEDGPDVINYLIGTLTRRGSGNPIYRPFFAPTPAGEREVLMDFLTWGASLDDAVFYHWNHYERTHLRKMVNFHGIDQGLAARVIDRLVDLSPVTTGAYAFPAYTQGLKDIARCLGFSWRQDDVSALSSVVLYRRYVESDGAEAALRQKIIDYNEDDCRATLYVFDWLMAQAS